MFNRLGQQIGEQQRNGRDTLILDEAMAGRARFAGGGVNVPATNRLLRHRELLIRLDEKQSSMQKEMNARFESVDARFESIDARFESVNARFESMNDQIGRLHTLMFFVLGGMFGLIGLIVWDRRSYIKPVKEDIHELISALRDYAKQHPELAEILRAHKLL